ncbi:MAG: hypothetical protein AAB553_00420 [Patescibacteria group bacterium]
MVDKPETFSSDELPLWIPDRVRGVLTRTLSKEPIDLTDQKVVGRHFVSKAEIEDIYDIVTQVESPVLIGMDGSRASLERPPLFRGVEEFDAYYTNKAQNEGSLSEYLRVNDLSTRDYEIARSRLLAGFNDSYKRGQIYPIPTVQLLVRDIDLVIIGGGRQSLAPYQVGRRTNVKLDVGFNSPYRMFESDPDDLESYLQRGLEKTIPLKYK